MFHNLSHILALLLTTAFLCSFHSAALSSLVPKHLITQGGYIIGENEHVLEQFHPTQQFIPASTIKLLTALTAFENLGKSYKFTTSFFLDPNNRLYIKGSGDPTLTSEVLKQITGKLHDTGLKTVSGYVVDNSLFDLEYSLPPGSLNSPNPYDAPNSALAANFNTIAINKAEDGTVFSGEPQTPLTQLGLQFGSLLPQGKHRVNIAAYPVSGSLPATLRYPVELMHEFFLLTGTLSKLEISGGTIPKNAILLYEHHSELTVLEICRSFLRYSNNFTANQLVLVAGGKKYGFPATWGKAKNALLDHAVTELKIDKKNITIKEGSGLSRETRITPAAMMKILQSFTPYRSLLRKKHGFLVKSGTMDSVYCYAGYLEQENQPVPFALFLNQKKNHRDSILKRLGTNLLALNPNK